jgi:DNA recombination protein RmuC
MLQQRHLATALQEALLQKGALEEKNHLLAEELGRRDQLIMQQQDKQLALSQELGSLKAYYASQKERLAEHESRVQELSQNLQQQFEALSNRIFLQHAEKITKDHTQQFQLLVSPLKEQLAHFEQQVQNQRIETTKEQTSLRFEIKRLAELNERLGVEAFNLSNALKGQNKLQGNWGELVLENILEGSGLIEGEQYTRQGRDLALRDSEGKSQKPDIILNLPDSKHIVIDAKMSLTAFEQAVNAADEEAQAQHAKQHMASILRHVDDLSGKYYQSNDKLKSPDFVVMFIPIEGAVGLALREKHDLFQSAWNKGVVIASPSTLLATIKTIASLWRLANQNRNAELIAQQGGRLYDKFVGFVGDMEKIKKSLDDTNKNYDLAFNKLYSGRGNLIGHVEKLRQLGVNHKKSLKDDFLDSALLLEEVDAEEVQT